jgi:hypothetical protein
VVLPVRRNAPLAFDWVVAAVPDSVTVAPFIAAAFLFRTFPE